MLGLILQLCGPFMLGGSNNKQFTWLGETQQRHVYIMALSLLRYDKMKNLEVFAVYQQRRSRRCGRLFLHAANQTVKHLVRQKYMKSLCLQM